MNLHTIGLVAAAALAALSQLEDVLPSKTLRVISAMLSFVVALATQISRVAARKPPPLSLLLLAALALAACPKPTPGGPVVVHPFVDCSLSAVQQCAPQALPAVNECLAGHGDVTTCLLGLIKPGTCLVYETVACLVRHEGDIAERAAARNPGDAVDVRRAARAREFLDGQHVTFAP